MNEINELRGLWRGKVKYDTKYHKKGEWIEGDFTRLEDDNVAIIPHIYGWGEVEVIADTLGECTGLRDKNGKLIFEGDIVESYKFGSEKFVDVITFRKGCFWYGNWNFVEFLCKFCDYELIGNIYDTPNC